LIKKRCNVSIFSISALFLFLGANDTFISMTKKCQPENEISDEPQMLLIPCMAFITSGNASALLIPLHGNLSSQRFYRR